MPRTDYESAWIKLQAHIATTKPGYGQQELLKLMAELAAEHQVPENLLDRAARLYGGSALTQSIPTINPAPGVDSIDDLEGSESPDISRPQEGNDGSKHEDQGRAAA